MSSSAQIKKRFIVTIPGRLHCQLHYFGSRERRGAARVTEKFDASLNEDVKLNDRVWEEKKKPKTQNSTGVGNSVR